MADDLKACRDECELLEKLIAAKDECAALRRQVDGLLEAFAHVAHESFAMQRVAHKEIWLRMTAEAHLALVRDRLYAERRIA